MASMLSFANNVFRTRDPSRDAATDRQRLDGIRAAITGAIQGATLERAGLRQRVDDYYAQASQILDNSEYGKRSEKLEREVLEAERQGRIGHSRLAALEVELERYRQLLAVVDGFTDATQSTTGNAA